MNDESRNFRADFNADASDRRTETINDHSIRISLLEQSMKSISKSLEDINGNISKLVLAVVLALLAAFLKFIISGGLA